MEYTELPKLCYHPWLAADEGRISHVLSRCVMKKICGIYQVKMEYIVPI